MEPFRVTTITVPDKLAENLVKAMKDMAREAIKTGDMATLRSMMSPELLSHRNKSYMSPGYLLSSFGTFFANKVAECNEMVIIAALALAIQDQHLRLEQIQRYPQGHLVPTANYNLVVLQYGTAKNVEAAQMVMHLLRSHEWSDSYFDSVSYLVDYLRITTGHERVYSF